MEILGFILLGIGAIIAVIYGFVLVVRAFQVSLVWGLGYLFVPFVSLIFIIVYWQVAKAPFLKSLISIPFMLVGMLLLPEGALIE
jgi:hypothetical protein